MALQNVKYAGTLSADTNRHPSPALWASCPLDLIQEDPSYGYQMQEDFTNFGKSAAVASNLGRYSGESGEWLSWEDTSCTITLPVQTVPDPGGYAQFNLTGTAHKAVVLEFGFGTAYSSGSAGPFMYTDGSGGKLWFECRFQVAQVSAGSNILFIGLAQSGTAVVPAAATSTTTLFDSGDAVGNVDLLGFDVLQTGPTALRCVYGKNGSARTSAGAAKTLAAATWYKVGFLIDPLAPYTALSGGVTAKRKKVRWFVDGVEQQSLADTATSPFPTAAVLTPVLHFQNGGTGTPTVLFDYVKAAQVYAS